MTKSHTRTISIFSLAMINVAALGSVKNWPAIAANGFASVFYLLLAALVFFLPLALISAELATGWPKKGGVYVWVKEAFGPKAGFLAVWILWIENVFWYPTILSFISSSIAYIFMPELAKSGLYTLLVVVGLFWTLTLINLRGMKTSSLISSGSVIFGTFVPGAVIVGLGIYWFCTGEPRQIPLTLDALIPDMTDFSKIALFVGILFSFCGIEMSGVHALEVKNPEKNYPKAILLSAIIILGTSILGALTIGIAVPPHLLNYTTGALDAVRYMFEAYHIPNWPIQVMAFLIAIGAIGSVSTWIVGPTKGLLAAAQRGHFPPVFRKTNKEGMPVFMVLAQATIVTILSFLFILLPSVSGTYWILLVLVALIYMVMYILMFAAAIKLRYTHPNVPRAYTIPGGKAGIWITGLVGIAACIFTLFVGFFPTADVKPGYESTYVICLGIGILFLCSVPYIILKFQKPSWLLNLPPQDE